jgi:SAM-dependent methyltransferase
MTLPVAKEKMALSFGAGAQVYDRLRPGYPEAAIDRAIGAATITTAVDLGAGTGLLTTPLCARGFDVTAIEPDPGMVQVLAARLPEVRAEIATAEHMPLPDASVDAVFIGQAFHWFIRPDADREIARVLRPGGIVAVLTNVNPDDANWEGVLHLAVLGVEQPQLAHESAVLAPDVFTDETEELIPNPQVLSRADFLALPATWSWVATATSKQQARVVTEAERLVEHIADPGGETVTMPYSTRVIRAVRGATEPYA